MELFAALITLILFIGSFFESSRETRVGKMLMGILLSNTVMQASDAMLWFWVDIPERVLAVRVMNMLSFAAGAALTEYSRAGRLDFVMIFFTSISFIIISIFQNVFVCLYRVYIVLIEAPPGLRSQCR